MDTISSCLKQVTRGCFMASIDLKDAFYSVPIAQNCRKYLKFKWQGMLFQFTALVMGLASSPRIFTKILKPIYAHLRQLGRLSIDAVLGRTAGLKNGARKPRTIL